MPAPPPPTLSPHEELRRELKRLRAKVADLERQVEELSGVPDELRSDIEETNDWLRRTFHYF